MNSKRKLISPLPPGVDKADPRISAWRLDQHEEHLEHLHLSKLDRPHCPDPSWLPVISMALMLFLGLTGLVSPTTVEHWVLGLKP